MKLFAFLLSLFLCSHVHGKTLIEVLRPDTIKSSKGTVCVAKGTNGKFAVISGRFAKGGKLKSPVAISFLDSKRARNSFQIRYDSKGYPTEIRFANGSRINLKTLEKRAALTDQKSPMSVPKFSSPFRLNWEKVIGISRNELTNSTLFGPAIGKEVAELLDKSFDNANNIIDRVYAIGAARGNLPAQAMVVLKGWRDDGWNLLLEEKVPKEAKMIKKSKDLYDAAKTIKDFFESPSLKDVPGLSNALEDISEEFNEKEVSGYWLAKINPKGKVTVQEVVSDYERFIRAYTIDEKISSLISPSLFPLAVEYRGSGYAFRFTATVNSRYAGRIEEATDAIYELIEVLNDFQDKKSNLYTQAYSFYKNRKAELVNKVSNDLVLLEVEQFNYEDELTSLAYARIDVMNNPTAYDPGYLPYLNNGIEDRQNALVAIDNAMPTVIRLQRSVQAIP